MSIFLFIVILLILVLVHEFGHFILAKKSGIRVDEFGFGFPPRLFYKKIGETKYSFNLIPFGGFVKIFGENPDDESINGPDKERSFVHKPRYTQAAVLFAGVFFNFILAWLLISVGFMSGMPTSQGSEPKGAILQDQNLVILSVNKDSPALLAGLKAGDKILSITSLSDRLENISTSSVQEYIGAHSNIALNMSIMRGEAVNEFIVIPKTGLIENKGAIGISLDTIGVLKLPVHKAIWQGLRSTAKLTWGTASAFGGLIKDSIFGKADFSQITGPVGIVGVVGDAYHFGFIYLLSFTAMISINLAVINLVPFPALDGGRLLFLLIEKIKGSPIKPTIANTVNAIGFGLLLLLMAIVTFHDIAKLF